MNNMNKKIIISTIVCLLLLSVVFVINAVLAYSPFYTHPDLAEQMAEFYGAKDPDSVLSVREIGWIREGAVREDTPPRWINHFYDPVHKIGWTGKHYGDLSEEAGYASGADMAPKPAIASVDWAENQEYQSAYGRQYGNQTWRKAIKSYLDGDEKGAFLALGHVLHLIGDLGVPAHTRNDSHPGISGDPGSPYEDYAKEYTNANGLKIAAGLAKENNPMPKFGNLAAAFDYLAGYSNKNFFSEDTIGNEEFSEPNINELKIIFQKGDNGIIKRYLIWNNVYLSLIISENIFTGERIFTIDDRNFVLPSYRENLFPQVVLTGAGVIDLFFREVAKYKNNPDLLGDIAPNSNEPLSRFIKHSPKLIVLKIWDTVDRMGVEAAKLAKKTAGKTRGVVAGAWEAAKKRIKGAARRSSEAPAAAAVPSDMEILSVGAEDAGAGAEPKPAGETSAAPEPAPRPEPQLEPEPESAPEPENGGADEGGGLEERKAESAALEAPEPEEPAETGEPGKNSNSNSGNGGRKFASLFAPAAPAGLAFGGGAPMATGISREAKEKKKEDKKEKSGPAEEIDETAPEAPEILSPAGFSSPFNKTPILFSGVAEASSTVSADIGNASTTAAADGSWTLLLDFPQGTSTVSFSAKDAAGNVSSSTEISLFVDSAAPEISLSVAECANSLSSSACLVATTSLRVSWSSPAGDFSYFNVDDNGVFSTTTATSTLAIAGEDSEYVFSVSAVDAAGNVSATSTKTAHVSSKPVVINEISFDGTDPKHSQDEWIELYNRTDYAIDLSGWRLRTKDGGPNIVFGEDSKNRKTVNKVIPANGYYLIERTDDDTVSDIPADWYGSFGGGKGAGLSNVGEVLKLYRPLPEGEELLVDETPSCFKFIIWCYMLRMDYRSVERINQDSFSSGWNKNYYPNIAQNGKGAGGVVISGTPKAANSRMRLIAGNSPDIRRNITLTKRYSPYVVSKKVLVFGEGSSLTVEPGVAVRFTSESGMKFENGAYLTARGTSEEPVYFTAFGDNERGGRLTLWSGNPNPGSWWGIKIKGAGKTSVIENAVFAYGGNHDPWNRFENLGNANLTFVNSPVIVSNSIFEHSKHNGLKLVNSTSTVSGNVFRHNDNSPWSAGLYISGKGEQSVKSNVFSNNFWGINNSGSNAVFDSNIFLGNSHEAIYSTGSFGGFTGNSGEGNMINGIAIGGGIARAGAIAALEANPLPYVIENRQVYTEASSTLVIKKGTVFKMNKKWSVNGDLAIEGENPEDIVFTSLYDDSVAPGTVSNPNSRQSYPGVAEGIEITSTGSLRASGFTARYGGKYEKTGAIVLNGASAEISNALFDNNYPYGIRAVNSKSVVIRNVRFTNHNYNRPWGGRGALSVSNSTTTLENVSFEDSWVGIAADALSKFFASGVEFTDSGYATTTPAGLW